MLKNRRRAKKQNRVIAYILEEIALISFALLLCKYYFIIIYNIQFSSIHPLYIRVKKHLSQ